MNQGEETTVEKVVSVFTSARRRDLRGGRGCRLLGDAPRWDLRRHAGPPRRELASHLDRGHLDLGHDGALIQVVNLQTFHLLQTVSNNSIGLDIGIPARGLSGEAYRGHFWDELFVFPS